MEGMGGQMRLERRQVGQGHTEPRILERGIPTLSILTGGVRAEKWRDSVHMQRIDAAIRPRRD